MTGRPASGRRERQERGGRTIPMGCGGEWVGGVIGKRVSCCGLLSLFDVKNIYDAERYAVCLSILARAGDG